MFQKERKRQDVGHGSGCEAGRWKGWTELRLDWTSLRGEGEAGTVLGRQKETCSLGMLIFIPCSGNEDFEEEGSKSGAIFTPLLAYFFGDSGFAFCSFHIYSFSRMFCKLSET